MSHGVLEEYVVFINKSARRAAVEWPTIVEEEDMFQDICVHILESPSTQRDLAEMDNDERAQTIHKIAQRLASKERNDYEKFFGDFRYSVDEVRDLLVEMSDIPRAITLGSSWATGDYTTSGNGHSDPTAGAALQNLGSDGLKGLLLSALNQLSATNSRQHQALVRRFIHGEVPDEEDAAAFMMIKRGLESLTEKINHGHKRTFSNASMFQVPSRSGKPINYLENPDPLESWGDGPGTRTVVRASTGRFLSKEGWDADYMPAPAHERDNAIEKEVWE